MKEVHFVFPGSELAVVSGTNERLEQPEQL